jgi:purine nucleosidase
MARKIIIDTDPGQDDPVAILMPLGSPEELDVQGIVTMAGNVPLSRTTYNARQILELAQRTDIALYAGCARHAGSSSTRIAEPGRCAEILLTTLLADRE